MSKIIDIIVLKTPEIGNNEIHFDCSDKRNIRLKSAFVCSGFLGNFDLQKSFYISNNLLEKKISRSHPFSLIFYLFFFLKFRNILINSINIKSIIVYTI